MDPVLYAFHAPHHDLDIVSRWVLRERVADHLLMWRRTTGACELMYLATCQRAMWILWGGDGEVLGLAPEVSRYEGEAAWRHLLEVASGLVSANLGDREIVDQLKGALESAKEAGAAGGEAQAVVEDVLREAQRLRVRAGLADGSASVATAALRHLEEALPKRARIAVVGMGPMSRYLAQRLPERDFEVVLANRTAAKAELMGYPTVSLEQLQHNPEGFDALVTATASPRPLFTLAAWEHLKRPPLRLLDLALPHDTEPALSQLSWVHRVDLAGFLAETEQAKARRFDTAQKAEPFIVGAVGRLRKRAQGRDLKYNTRTAQDRLTDAWETLETDATSGVLEGLDEAQQEAIKNLLKRGRTLSFRALSQTHHLGRP
jgi:glutamyl-tRNA reductase